VYKKTVSGRRGRSCPNTATTMPLNLKINAVAFVSPQNHPILIRAFSNQDDHIKYHYIAHTSLDVVEERGLLFLLHLLDVELIMVSSDGCRKGL